MWKTFWIYGILRVEDDMLGEGLHDIAPVRAPELGADELYRVKAVDPDANGSQESFHDTLDRKSKKKHNQAMNPEDVVILQSLDQESAEKPGTTGPAPHEIPDEDKVHAGINLLA